MLAAVRVVNRLELLAETMRAALGAIAAAAPDWLREVASPEWHERYDRRVEDFHLPATPTKREAYAAQVGADGFRLLDALDGAGAPESMRELPAVLVMCRVWARHYERGGRCSEDDVAGGNHDDTSSRVRLRPIRGRGPGDHPDDRIESPYDSEARFRTKGSMGWVGYMVHLTETCDAARPRLIVHAEAMPANTHEAGRTGAIHDALATKGMAPSEHLVDSGYVSGAHIVAARERHGVDLVGPPRPDLSWQAREGSAFVADDFVADWESHRVRCPEGRTSTTWGAYTDKASGRSYVRAGVPLVSPDRSAGVERGAELGGRAHGQRGVWVDRVVVVDPSGDEPEERDGVGQRRDTDVVPAQRLHEGLGDAVALGGTDGREAGQFTHWGFVLGSVRTRGVVSVALPVAFWVGHSPSRAVSMAVATGTIGQGGVARFTGVSDLLCMRVPAHAEPNGGMDDDDHPEDAGRAAGGL